MRNRSMAMVLRGRKILMIETFRFNHTIFELPAGGVQAIKNVCWKELRELSEKDRAFLWYYGLMDVDGFFQEVLSWGDEVSYPGR